MPLQNRPDELRDEAESLLQAASFLIVSAARKNRLAEQLDRMSRTGVRLGGGGGDSKRFAK